MDQEFGDIICSFQKNSSELVGAGLYSQYNKKHFFIRVFVPSIDEPDSLIPTRKGINLPVEDLPEIKSALEEIPEIMARNKTIKVIEKNKRQQLRIGISEFRSHIYIYIRIYTYLEADGYEVLESKFVPTKKGINIALPKYQNLMEMIDVLMDS